MKAYGTVDLKDELMDYSMVAEKVEMTEHMSVFLTVETTDGLLDAMRGDKLDHNTVVSMEFDWDDQSVDDLVDLMDS